MSNFWFSKWLHPQIKPELGFTGFYLASLGCYWNLCSRRKPDIGRLSQTFPGLTSLGPAWLEPGVCNRILKPSEAVWQPDEAEHFADVDRVCRSDYHC